MGKRLSILDVLQGGNAPRHHLSASKRAFFEGRLNSGGGLAGRVGIGLGLFLSARSAAERGKVIAVYEMVLRWNFAVASGVARESRKKAMQLVRLKNVKSMNETNSKNTIECLKNRILNN